ncbi:MAG TPA: beta-ketoacyl-ACP synthase III [Gammaproteobacteria bacterium]|nr:beta-ketoacyl-ACP synthase III [Gammaproteobacteria bacterium]
MYSRILGTGRCLPRTIVTNQDLVKTIDTSDQWIRERSGIRQRHIAADDETTTDLAEGAARNALEAAGIEPEELDLIVFGTTTPDQIFPNSGVILQSKLGIAGIPAFSLEAACTGFIYALSVADKFVRTGDARCALVIGAERISALVDWSDRSTCVLFGDGAGAVVLGLDEEPGVLATHLHADGTYKDLLYFPAGPGKDFRRTSDSHVMMKGNEVFRVAVTQLGKVVEETLERNHLDKEDIDWLIPHQANIRIIQATAKKLQIPMERVVVTVDQHANTSAASVPMALDVAVRDGRVRRGQTLLLEAFGGGFTWGSALVRY